MDRTKYDSTRKMPLPMLVAAGFALGFFGLCVYADNCMPRTDKEIVHWVEIPQAVALSKQFGKPILYDFSAEWCGPCKILSKKVFGNKNYAHFINQAFIPVRVIDRKREETMNPIEVDSLEKKYGVDGFPTLAIDRLDGSEPQTQVGYQGAIATYQFLQKSSFKIPDQYKYLHLKLFNLSEAQKLSAQTKKPLLILFWNDRNEFSRHEFLSDKDLAKMVEHDFVATEVPMPLDLKTIKSTAARDLLMKLSIKRAPALVIVPSDGSAPHFQLGSSRSVDNRDFLAKYLELN